MRELVTYFFILLCLAGCRREEKARSTEGPQGFITQKEGRFFIDDQPYYFIGTNFWYGAILASEGEGGDRERLAKELDFMKSIGIDNLRVLVGADGYPGQEVKIMPTLQLEPGIYNDTIFDGLDYLMAELGKRKMYAVLFINNSWEWSGGYGQYLNWAGKGDVPEKGVHEWNIFRDHVSQYAACDECKELFFNHARHVIGRTNRYTGLKYSDDPAIMSWQIGNEPRAFSEEAKEPFVRWIAEAAALFRELAPNHLISIGNEGSMGCEEDIALYEKIHNDPNVDYLTIHIWPKNWSWLNTEDIPGSVDVAIEKSAGYINDHLALAEKMNKAITIEEFGFPRDNHRYTREDPTRSRDRYYAAIFERIVEESRSGGKIAGCNFWAWGGFGEPAHEFWKPWDDYVGDPSQEEQGLNSVFNTDSTIEVIGKFTTLLNRK